MTLSSFFPPLSIVMVAALAAGCAMSNDQALLNNPDYQNGYEHGCRTSSTAVDTPVRDQTLYDSSDAYRSGWNDGHGICGWRTSPAPWPDAAQSTTVNSAIKSSAGVP